MSADGDAAPAGPPAAPAADRTAAPPSARPRWLESRWGGPVLSVAAILTYLVVAQDIPGLVIAVAYAPRHGGQIDEAWIKASAPSFLPAILGLGVVVAVAMAATLRAVRWMPRGPAARGGSGAVRASRFVVWVVVGTVLCLAAEIGTSAALQAMGHRVEEQEEVLQMLRSGDPFALAAIVLAAPVAEEIVLRRIVFRALHGANGAWIAYVGSSLAFATIHFHPSAFASYVVIGLTCAFVYARTGSIAAPILVHALNNGMAVLTTQT